MQSWLHAAASLILVPVLSGCMAGTLLSLPEKKSREKETVLHTVKVICPVRKIDHSCQTHTMERLYNEYGLDEFPPSIAGLSMEDGIGIYSLMYGRLLCCCGVSESWEHAYAECGMDEK